MNRTIYIYKNSFKKRDTHPDYRIIIKEGDEITLEAGGYIATDKQTGQKRKDKHGNPYIYGKLTEPKKKDGPQESQQQNSSDDGFIY